MLRYRHGEAWSIGRADAPTDAGRFKTVDVVRSVRYEDFVNNDLGKLLDIFQDYIRGFTQKNEEIVVETTAAAAESAGNEVSVSGAGSCPRAGHQNGIMARLLRGLDCVSTHEACAANRCHTHIPHSLTLYVGLQARIALMQPGRLWRFTATHILCFYSRSLLSLINQDEIGGRAVTWPEGRDT